MKRMLNAHAEAAIILLSLAIFAFIKLLLANKFAFLNLYFIPVLLAGYYLGRRPAIMSSVLGVLLTLFFVVRWPSELLAEKTGWMNLGLDLVVWSSFLMLCAIAISTLNENRRRRVALATQGLLKEYVQRSIEAGDSHTKRVAKLAVSIAAELHLPGDLVKQIEAAALLHDLGENQLALDIMKIDTTETTDKAQALIVAAMPLAAAGRHYRIASAREGISLGAKIVAMADLYDEVSEKNRELTPWWESLDEIQRKGRFDQHIVGALRKTLSKHTPVPGV